MMITNWNPVHMAVTDFLLPEVESLARKILDHQRSCQAESLPTDSAHAAETENEGRLTTEEVSQKMIQITLFEMLKNNVFYPENDEDKEETDW